VDSTKQFEVLIIMIITGALLGVLFDFYRIMRGFVKPRWYITSVGDLVYWLLATVIVFGALLIGNWGEVRVYVFFGLAAGVAGYNRWLSRPTLKVLIQTSRFTIKTINKARRLVDFILVKPGLFVWKAVTKFISKFVRKVDRRPPPDKITPND